MTACAARRRRNTVVAAVLATVGVVLAGVITVVGASTLADSRAGRNVAVGVPATILPATPTALLAVVDDSGTLTTAVAAVLSPEGVGGSLVVLPASADSSFGRAGDVLPLAETLAVGGAEMFVAEAEAMAAISFDVVEIADTARMTQLLEPLGEVDLALPDELPDDLELPGVPPGRSGPSAGDDVELDTEGIVDVLTAATPTTADEPDAVLDPLRVAVWAALAANVGDGIGPTPEGLENGTFPVELDGFLARLFAGQVGVRDLQTTVPTPDQNPRGVDVVGVDRAEILLVFAQIAPARVAAPNASLTFRVESHFTAEQLARYGVNNADVVRDVIQILLFLQANVISVETTSSGAPDVTQATVTDLSLLDRIDDGWRVLFGEVDVGPAESRITGVDATVVLGESYLVLRAERLAEAEARDASPADTTDPSTTDPRITDPRITDPRITDPRITDPNEGDTNG